MYARLLFVVVGIFKPFSSEVGHRFASRKRVGRETSLFSANFPIVIPELRLGTAGGGGYTLGGHE